MIIELVGVIEVREVVILGEIVGGAGVVGPGGVTRGAGVVGLGEIVAPGGGSASGNDLALGGGSGLGGTGIGVAPGGVAAGIGVTGVRGAASNRIDRIIRRTRRPRSGLRHQWPGSGSSPRGRWTAARGSVGRSVGRSRRSQASS